MNIEKTTYGDGLEAYCLTHDNMEMIVVTSIGPRILSFKWEGGPNLLFNDKSGGGYKDWKIYGGGRMWTGPENEACYTPDNAPCEVIVDEDRFTVFGSIEASGLQKSIEISPNLEGLGFRVDYVLRNTGEMLAAGNIWALTCVEPTGKVMTPWGEGSEAWATQMVRFWRDWAGHHTNIASPQWKLGQDTFGIEPTGEEGKVGLYTESGFMAQLREDGTFIKTFEPIPEAEYPDGFCNIAFYTCDTFVEMETMSPKYTFVPGGEYVHSETWMATSETFETDEWERIMDWMDV